MAVLKFTTCELNIFDRILQFNLYYAHEYLLLLSIMYDFYVPPHFNCVSTDRYANDIEIAQSKRDFELKKAAYDMEVQTKKAEADLAYSLQVISVVM